jgi:hypothetical protein
MGAKEMKMAKSKGKAGPGRKIPGPASTLSPRIIDSRKRKK